MDRGCLGTHNSHASRTHAHTQSLSRLPTPSGRLLRSGYLPTQAQSSPVPRFVVHEREYAHLSSDPVDRNETGGPAFPFLNPNYYPLKVSCSKVTLLPSPKCRPLKDHLNEFSRTGLWGTPVSVVSLSVHIGPHYSKGSLTPEVPRALLDPRSSGLWTGRDWVRLPFRWYQRDRFLFPRDLRECGRHCARRVFVWVTETSVE